MHQAWRQQQWRKIRDALWHSHAEKAIELARMLAASLLEERPRLPPFHASCAVTALGAATRLLEFLTNNRTTLPNYHRERGAGRRISTAAAESVMNHLINRRLSKRQQARWSMSGAHYVRLARVEMLDGRLVEHFAHRLPRFRSPELPLQSQPP